MLHETGIRQSLLLVVAIFALSVSGNPTFGQASTEPTVPKLNYEAVPNFFQLGNSTLPEKFVRSLADDLFVTAHSLRVDSEDNLWTTDVGAHVVLKLSPEGRVLLSLGRMRMPGDDVLHFNQPTDVAFDRDGNIYVTDGEGNSRVLSSINMAISCLDGE